MPDDPSTERGIRTFTIIEALSGYAMVRGNPPFEGAPITVIEAEPVLVLLEGLLGEVGRDSEGNPWPSAHRDAALALLRAHGRFSHSEAP